MSTLHPPSPFEFPRPGGQDAGEIVRGALDVLGETPGFDLLSAYKVVGDALHLLAQLNYPAATVQSVIPLTQGVLARCVGSRQPQHVRRTEDDPEFPATLPQVQAILCAPILIDGDAYGVIAVESCRQDDVDDAELGKLQVLANRVGVMIQDVQIHEDLRRRLTTAAGLHAGALDIASALEETELMQVFSDRVLQMVQVETVAIFLHDPDREGLVVRAVTGEPRVAVGDLHDEHAGAVGQAYQKGSAIAAPDHAQFLQEDPTWPREDWVQGAVRTIPLLVKGRPLGVLALVRPRGHSFTPEEQHLSGLLANQIATALENRRLYQAEQVRAQQLTLLNRITTDALRAENVDDLLGTLTDHLCMLIGADICTIDLWDESSQKAIPSAASGGRCRAYRALEIGPDDGTLTRAVLAAREPLVVADLARSPHVASHIADFWQARSLLGLPLIAGKENLGAAALGFRSPHRFTAEEIAICTQAAAQASIAVAKTKLLQTERQQRELAETQLDFSFRLMEATTIVEAVEALLETLEKVARYDGAAVVLFAPEDPEMGSVAAAFGYDSAATHRSSYPIDDFPFLRQVQRDRTPLYLPTVATERGWLPDRRLDGREVQALLLVPLLYDPQSEMIGCLALESFQPHAFSRSIRNNIILLCNQTGSVMRTLRLFEETHRRLNEASILAEISEKLNQTLDLDELLQVILNRVAAIIDPSKKKQIVSEIILRLAPGDDLQIAASLGLSPEEVDFFNQRPFYAHEGTFARSILQGEWVELDGKEMVDTHAVDPIPLPDAFHQLLNIPMRADGEVIGVITANRLVSDPNTKRLLGAIAELAGAAIHKTRLLAQARSQAVALMEAHETLHEMDRQRDEFIQNITHDLRAPLTFVRGYADLMAEGALGPITDEQKEALDVIAERTDAIQRLVSDILQSKEIAAQPLAQEAVSLDEVARTAVLGAQVAARQAELSITLDITSASCRVLGDRARLGQVFDNLLSNAIKFSPAGGVIRVRLQQQGPMVAVSVSDDGIGIPEAELDRIWDRFYRAKGTAAHYSGTGLGLANARRIIEAHGGRIWAESRAGGSTFTFQIPLYATPSEMAVRDDRDSESGEDE